MTIKTVVTKCTTYTYSDNAGNRIEFELPFGEDGSANISPFIIDADSMTVVERADGSGYRVGYLIQDQYDDTPNPMDELDQIDIEPVDALDMLQGRYLESLSDDQFEALDEKGIYSAPLETLWSFLKPNERFVRMKYFPAASQSSTSQRAWAFSESIFHTDITHLVTFDQEEMDNYPKWDVDKFLAANLKDWASWAMGDNWGMVLADYSKGLFGSTEQVGESEIVWGLIGHSNALENLNVEMSP